MKAENFNTFKLIKFSTTFDFFLVTLSKFNLNSNRTSDEIPGPTGEQHNQDEHDNTAIFVISTGDIDIKEENNEDDGDQEGTNTDSNVEDEKSANTLHAFLKIELEEIKQMMKLNNQLMESAFKKNKEEVTTAINDAKNEMHSIIKFYAEYGNMNMDK